MGHCKLGRVLVPRGTSRKAAQKGGRAPGRNGLAHHQGRIRHPSCPRQVTSVPPPGSEAHPGHRPREAGRQRACGGRSEDQGLSRTVMPNGRDGITQAGPWDGEGGFRGGSYQPHLPQPHQEARLQAEDAHQSVGTQRGAVLQNPQAVPGNQGMPPRPRGRGAVGSWLFLNRILFLAQRRCLR